MGKGIESLDKFTHDAQDAPGVAVGEIERGRFWWPCRALQELLVGSRPAQAGASAQAGVGHGWQGMIGWRLLWRCTLLLTRLIIMRRLLSIFLLAHRISAPLARKRPGW